MYRQVGIIVASLTSASASAVVADWAALVANTKGDGIGYWYTWNESSKAAALNNAMEICQRHTSVANGCREIVSTQDCIGGIWNGGIWYAAVAKTRKKAMNLSVAHCSSKTGKKCRPPKGDGFVIACGNQ